MNVPLSKIAQQNVTISEIASFHIGGDTVELSNQPRLMMRVAGEGMAREVDLNGSYVTGQLYANHVKLAAPRHAEPVMFWHGGAMTGVTWETTPDGRPGWQWLFLQAGYDVIVTDAVERGRASWSPFPQIYDTGPVFRTKEEAWSMYRVGARSSYAAREPYQGQRFPVSAFDALAAQLVPRWTTHDDMTLDAYQALLEKVGPVHLVAHSQGGWFALNMVRRVPHLVRSVVVIEPAGAPRLASEDVACMGDIPHLFIWGDFIEDVPSWKKYRAATDQYREVLAAAGKQTREMDLPAMGIRGNSHVPMMDDNSADIAALVTDWMAQNPGSAT
ncbi:alpha/beta fold hydrolase [Thalassospira sp. TSL5-1]|uniref:alpha/beta fold hydrolase n=1 Tax=Thalassospira sp. TSL5-1 TaxID=1544451 RepID=UPI00093F9394|nr:alpha/beta fold hydrolase [Thalassospira sp. TSL5-1]